MIDGNDRRERQASGRRPWVRHTAEHLYPVWEMAPAGHGVEGLREAGGGLGPDDQCSSRLCKGVWASSGGQGRSSEDDQAETSSD